MRISDEHLERRRAVADMLRGDRVVVQVNGNCMAPVLEHGWQVEVEPRRSRPGDIVALVRKDGSLVVHRYLGTRPWRDRVGRWHRLAVTRPDDGEGFDAEVPLGDVLGVVNGVRTLDGEGFTPVHVGPAQRLYALGWGAKYAVRTLGRRIRRSFGSSDDRAKR